MIVARTRFVSHNAEPPGANRAAADVVTIRNDGVERSSLYEATLFSIPRAATQEVCLMTQNNHVRPRSRPEGRGHRARLRAQILPNLWCGSRVPSSAWLGRFLGISASEGYAHMRRVLAEAGVATETRGAGRGRRVYVIDIPTLRAAA